MPSTGDAKKRQNKRRNSIRDAWRAVDRARAILRYVHQRMGLQTNAAGQPISAAANQGHAIGAGVHVCVTAIPLTNVATLVNHASAVPPLPPQQPGLTCSAGPQQVPPAQSGPAYPGLQQDQDAGASAGAGPSSMTMHETQESDGAAESLLLDASVWDGLEQDAQLTRLLAHCEDAANELDMQLSGRRDRDLPPDD